ncbi:hypothetical protein [Salipiger mucosus]|uniref:Uncharacterized protein n=1 Tax=Salipiger mucosus DSM 16094 TaxID=1123237 RepID=S9QYU1_9RHOB|nr:hypothetical protein [Salipiger mucosus]EPX84762.1 hypothetical protein Salmuc_01335 [Salipiger mucosus DSM 16094]
MKSSSVPVAGIAAAAYFEKKDRRAWLAENPGKTSADYACEIAELPMEISLPDGVIPECEANLE